MSQEMIGPTLCIGLTLAALCIIPRIELEWPGSWMLSTMVYVAAQCLLIWQFSGAGQ